MLQPLGVAIPAFDHGHDRLGASVGVVGCGPIGLLLLQVARAAGAGSVVAVDPLAHRRAAARTLGADRVLSPEEATGSDDVWGISDDGAGGLDVVFEVAGTNDAVEMAITAARPGARVVLVGIPDDDRTTFSASSARRKGLTIVLVRRMKDVYPRAIRLVQQGRVDTGCLVSGRHPLHRVDEAFRPAASRDGLKVIVDPAQGH
jgi:L-iditol 2-dehydrogenase